MSFNTLTLLNYYAPYVLWFLTIINFFAFLIGLIRHHLLQDRFGSLMIKGAVISEIITVFLFQGMKLLYHVSPAPPLSYIDVTGSVPTIELKPIGASGAVSYVVSVFLAFGLKILQSIVNGFILPLVTMAVKLASYFLLSNDGFKLTPHSAILTVWGITGALFAVFLILKGINYALAVNGMGDPKEAAQEFWNVFLYFLIAAFSIPMFLFLFRLNQIFASHFLDLANKISEGTASFQATPDAGTKAWVSISKILLQPMIDMLQIAGIEVVPVDPNMASSTISWIKKFLDSVKFIFKGKFDWEIALIFGLYATVGIEALVLLFRSIIRIVYGYFLYIFSPLIIFLMSFKRTQRISERFINDILAVIFAPALISVMVYLWALLAAPNGALDLPAKFGNIFSEQTRPLGVAFLRIVFGLVFTALLYYLPSIVGSGFSSLLAIASGLGKTLSGGIAGGIASGFMAARTTLSAAESAARLPMTIAGFKALGRGASGFIKNIGSGLKSVGTRVGASTKALTGSAGAAFFIPGQFLHPLDYKGLGELANARISGKKYPSKGLFSPKNKDDLIKTAKNTYDNPKWTDPMEPAIMGDSLSKPEKDAYSSILRNSGAYKGVSKAGRPVGFNKNKWNSEAAKKGFLDAAEKAGIPREEAEKWWDQNLSDLNGFPGTQARIGAKYIATNGNTSSLGGSPSGGTSVIKEIGEDVSEDHEIRRTSSGGFVPASKLNQVFEKIRIKRVNKIITEIQNINKEGENE